MAAEAPWAPTRILRVGQALRTAARPVRVMTDAGEAFLKPLRGGEQEKHYLAKEWIGTAMARLVGLRTFDYALIHVADVPEIPLHGGEFARPGVAFITRSERGDPWGGSDRELRRVWNHADIAKLVLFDTWVRNSDRYMPGPGGANLDNVFLSREGAPDSRSRTLKAIDHTHCLNAHWPLTEGLASGNNIESRTVYGLFPAFRAAMGVAEMEEAADCLRHVRGEQIRRVVERIPPDWDVPQATRDAVAEFLMLRAKFIADRIVAILWPPQPTLF